MFKNTKLILLLFFCALAFLAKAQKKMIVGYLPNYRFKVSKPIDYCKLTHLNICFANPDAQGNILLTDTLQNILDRIKLINPDIKIFISLAGGALTKDQKYTWKKHIDIPKNRPAFIDKIIKYVEKYNFDGVDVDLEWRNVTKGYSGFVLELKKELESRNIQMSAALPGTYRYSNITDEAIHSFDFINLMAYDETGSWAPHKPGQHSSVEFAKKSISFWRDSIGIPAEKLTLGLPFYAYDFTNPKKTKSHTIADILAMNYQNLFSDSTGLIYYNGKSTIEKKIEIAVEDLAGVMIWELGQDTTGDFAMIKTIHNKFNDLKLETSNKYCGLTDKEIQAIENEQNLIYLQEDFRKNVRVKTFKKFIRVYSKTYKNMNVEVFNSSGEKQVLKTKNIKGKEYYKILKFKKGKYSIVINQDDLSFAKKLNLK